MAPRTVLFQTRFSAFADFKLHFVAWHSIELISNQIIFRFCLQNSSRYSVCTLPNWCFGWGWVAIEFAKITLYQCSKWGGLSTWEKFENSWFFILYWCQQAYAAVLTTRPVSIWGVGGFLIYSKSSTVIQWSHGIGLFL